MRIFAAVLLVSLGASRLVSGQITEVPSAGSVNLPMYRPILVGQGPDALINRIDTEELLKDGQKDGWVRFICAVRKNGEVMWSQVFGSAPNSDLLKQELAKRLSAAEAQRFMPGVYNHKLVDGIFYGTLTFQVVNGKSRLRIFSNQQPAEVAAESDFIDPQPFFGAESKFTGFHYPEDKTPVTVDGSVQVKLKIDANGSVLSGVVAAEEPPYLGFAEAAVVDLTSAKFIPAFRAGKPVECEVVLPVLYKARNF